MIEDIVKKYNIRTAHSNQVKIYALMLFDALNGKLFDFGEKEKSYLGRCSAFARYRVPYRQKIPSQTLARDDSGDGF